MQSRGDFVCWIQLNHCKSLYPLSSILRGRFRTRSVPFLAFLSSALLNPPKTIALRRVGETLFATASAATTLHFESDFWLILRVKCRFCG